MSKVENKFKNASNWIFYRMLPIWYFTESNYWTHSGWKGHTPAPLNTPDIVDTLPSLLIRCWDCLSKKKSTDNWPLSLYPKDTWWRGSLLMMHSFLSLFKILQAVTLLPVPAMSMCIVHIELSRSCWLLTNRIPLWYISRFNFNYFTNLSWTNEHIGYFI